jgi:hypothetical protein
MPRTPAIKLKQALMPVTGSVAKWLESFKEFAPRQKPASFALDQVMEQLTTGGTASN